MKIENAYDAYWFLYNHPNQVDVHPEHPILKVGDYESKGISTGKLKKKTAIKGKPRDAGYQKAWEENRTDLHHEGQFITGLHIYYTKVQPKNRRVNIEDNSKNTKVECWLETGPAQWDNYANKYIGNVHDYKLDCGASTFDKALIKLARLVQKKYGDYDA